VNSQTTPVDSTLLRNKLGRLAIRLQSQANPKGTSTSFNTLEKTVSESIKILSQFYRQLSDPTYKPIDTVIDTVPDAELFNNNFVAIQDDLEIVFHEFENLEGVILGEFNYMVSRLNRLNRKLKSVSSQMADFILFSDLPTKDAVFFGDSFNNLNRVEAHSPLLNEKQCEINQVEGIATLPVDRTAQVILTITETPVINSNSNGTLGNNEEVGASLNGSISDILDNNADTWFEYERVVSSDDGVSLILDFTINIGDEKIINFLRINPNNFGTKTQVKIIAIDTSVDGKDFVSIKDDIPIADFTVEDEVNVFTLAPSTSKFAGQGLYTFTPRLAKYVHLTLKQTTPYTMTTSTGTKYRYAIGVRDVDIQTLPYDSKGEVISTEYTLTDEVRKVVLLSNQNPDPATTSSLASITHYVSPDNGVTWHQIRPKVSAGSANVDQSVVELLDFNGVSADSIATASPVKSLRYKALLKRETSAFTKASSELAQEIANMTELHAPPTTTPFTISLQNTPVTGTLKLIDPQFGSRGKTDVSYQIANGTGNKLIVLLPFKPMQRDLEKYESGGDWYIRDLDPERVSVAGELWNRVIVHSGANNEYILNYDEGKLEFGNGTDGNKVPLSAAVSMTLTEERISPGRGTDHIAELDYPTAQDQKQVELSIAHPATNKTSVLKKGAIRFQLEKDVLFDSTTGESYAAPSPYKITFSDLAIFSTEKTFGTETLASPGDWYIDWANGVLYSYSATVSNTDTTISYSYYPRTILTESEWSFTDSGTGIANAISVSDNKYQTFTGDTLDVPITVRYFNLAHLSIVQGTVSFTDSNSVPTIALKTEVQFIDGRSELLGVVQAAEALEPITSTGIISIPFKVKISSDNGFAVTFSKPNIFKVEKTSMGDVNSGIAGDYYIDRTYSPFGTGRIYVKLTSTVASPGTVSYSYVNPQAVLEGRYSINYETGEVFCYDPTPSNIIVDYEYTDYRVRYDIARQVSSDDWEFDSSEDKLTISDREILKNQRTAQQVDQQTSGRKFYQASYQYVKSTRANVDELEPFFSPVLKDYALKIITKSRLV